MTTNADPEMVLRGPDWEFPIIAPLRFGTTDRGAAPAYMHDEIAARVDYTRLSWLGRMVTPPPPGWPGGHIARAVAWGAARVHTKRASGGARKPRKP